MYAQDIVLCFLFWEEVYPIWVSYEFESEFEQLENSFKSHWWILNQNNG